MAKKHDVVFGGMKARLDWGGAEGGIFARSGAIQTAHEEAFSLFMQQQLHGGETELET